MIKNDYKKMDRLVKHYHKSVIQLFDHLDSILKRPDKDHQIVFGRSTFKFGPVFEKKELKKQAKDRARLIKMIFKDTFCYHLKLLSNRELSLDLIFDRLFTFTLGADPVDHQMNMSDKKISPVVSIEPCKKAIAIDENSYHVKMERLKDEVDYVKD